MENSDLEQPNYYVAIGASAGGLEALQDFFQSLPKNSGAAFIVVQHLSPDFKSVMNELLGRCTDMHIYHVTDDVTAHANTVYLIPPRKNMMIAEGRLLLSDQVPNSGVNFPIDIFFRSLAEDQHHHAIGIILSGTGSDGSRGIQAIKEVNGLIMVQDPRSAKFDGMPFSAVKTGLADVIASASELPQKLIQFINHPIIKNQDESLIKQVENSDSAFHEIFRLLKQTSDIDFTLYKPATVARRIGRRIGVHGLTNLKEYHALLIEQSEELKALSKDMLIGVTRFFRDDQPFEIMENTVIPDILESSPSRETIRVWVAGCSSGEEAYSIAILFDEAQRKLGITRQIKIFATDVDPDAIGEASSGQFGLNLQEDMSEERLKEYFIRKEDHFRVISSLRQMVVFASHNLINDPPFSNCHLAICRNVLIYFQSEAQKRVLSMMHFSLKKDGYLFLGSSESLGDIEPHFQVIHERSKIYKKAITGRMMAHALGRSPNLKEKNTATASLEKILSSFQDKNISCPPIILSLIEDYVPPCVLLNESLEILTGYGDVSSFTKNFQSGEFSSKIQKVIVEELSVAVSTAIHRAISEQSSITYSNIRLTCPDGKFKIINLRVQYKKQKPTDSYQLAVIFESTDNQQSTSNSSEVVSYNQDDQSQQRIIDLELELKKNKEHLQVTVEELETTNEELQSSNEELLSANEELQSTNEELQSVNEELYTVNSEYQEKIEEITQTNTDLDNIMRSTDIGTLFLDEAMLIRKFTPALARDVNILEADIGRPFHHISHSLKDDQLLQDIANVIETGESKEKSIQTIDDRKALLKIAPYMNEVGQKCGCVLSIMDATEKEMLYGQLSESYEKLKDTLQTILKKDFSNIKVLVAGNAQADNEYIKNLLSDIKLPNAEYDIQTCAGVKETKFNLSKSSFDICLIDYELGHENALELVEGLSKKAIKLPAFVLMSEQITETLIDSAKQIGIHETLNKDELTPKFLEKIINYALQLTAIGQHLNYPNTMNEVQ